MKWAPVLLVLVLSVFASSAGAREVELSHTPSDGSVGSLRFGGVGPGLSVTTLQSLRFALEFDPDLIAVDELLPGLLLQDSPPDALQIEYLPGRVEVAVSYDVPLAVDAAVNNHLFVVNLDFVDDYYQGERVTIRTVGPVPGEPVQWIDDEQNPDDIKVIVQNKVIVEDSGVTCLAGDALGDGEVDAGDSGAVLRIVTDIVEAPDVLTRCGSDVNQDGNVYTGDAVLILRRAAGFDDFFPRWDIRPEVELVTDDHGARLRVRNADFAHGATLRLRAVGALRFEEVRTSSPALASRRIEASEAVVALADVKPVATGDGVLEFAIEIQGTGRIVVEALSLYGADGEARFEQTEPLFADLSEAPGPLRTALGNSPNPFNPATTFWMELPREGRVVLELFDMRGRMLATLVDEVRPAGRSEHRFDGSVDGGGVLASGVYFARMRFGPESTVHRITLLK